jgi:hypothetical protein
MFVYVGNTKIVQIVPADRWRGVFATQDEAGEPIAVSVPLVGWAFAEDGQSSPVVVNEATGRAEILVDNANLLGAIPPALQNVERRWEAEAREYFREKEGS